MLIWTVLNGHEVCGGAQWPPPEVAWPAAPEEAGATRPVVALGPGRWALCRRAVDGTLRLERLLSTDPADFLRPEWWPGATL